MDKAMAGGPAAGTADAGLDTWRMLGYTLNRTWVTTAFFSAVLFQRYASTDMAVAANEVYRTSVLALAVALALLALLHRQVIGLSRHTAFDYAGPALAGVGILLLVPNLATGHQIAPAVLWGSAALTGTGSALVLLSVGRRFVGAPVRACIREVLWATVGCALLTFLIMCLPFTAALAVELALPFCCVATLHHRTHASQQTSPTRTGLGERISTKMLLKLATCAAVLGIMAGITRDLYFGSDGAALGDTYRMVNCLVPLVAALALLGSLAATREANIEALYRPTFFFCIVGFAVMPLSGSDVSLPFAVVTAGYTLFEILVWVILSEVASRFQFTSVQVFGFGRSLVLLVGVIAGTLIANMLLNLGMGPQLFSAVSAVAIVCIAFLRTYVLTGTDATTFSADLFEEDRQAVENPAADARRACDESANRATSTAAGPQVAPQARRAKGDTPDAKGAAEAPEARPLPRKVPFQRKCAIIGDFYGLTPRETDVFRLLAAGRNSTRIQEELSISAGTVNTHSHHVFQKLDVHSQQEVIDLFEHADLDAMQAQLASRAG